MISVIIPLCHLVRKAHKARLEAVQKALEDFYQGVEVIVVEQSLDGEYYFIPRLKATCVRIAYPMFNKSWCLNVGAKKAKGDILVFADADMYAKNYPWKKLEQWMNNRSWGFCWDTLTYTKHDRHRQMVFAGSHPLGIPPEKPCPGLSEGGLVAFKKDFFCEIGMYNERLQELGGIDNEIIIRAKYKDHKYEMFPFHIYHLLHPQKKKSSRPTRQENIRVLKQTKRETEEMINNLKSKSQGKINCPEVE